MEKIVKHPNGNVANPFPDTEEAVEYAKAKGSEVLEKAIARGQSLWSGAQSSGRKSWGQTKSIIHKHPAQAIGVAVLLGVVVGMFLKFRGKD